MQINESKGPPDLSLVLFLNNNSLNDEQAESQYKCDEIAMCNVLSDNEKLEEVTSEP